MRVWVGSRLRRRRINRRAVARFAAFAMRRAGFPAGAELSVLFVGGRAMRRLNRTYRGEDRDTDVLAFPMGGGRGGPAGDVVISIDAVRRGARRFGTGIERETRLCLAHGILHLRGFEDRTPPGGAAMARRQEAIVRAAGGRWNVTG
ncbi:MAG: rRNA maturation RNase YbeY [bacterium]|nr:rRNA maturation RNase YbeY [bacterium]